MTDVYPAKLSHPDALEAARKLAAAGLSVNLYLYPKSDDGRVPKPYGHVYIDVGFGVGLDVLTATRAKVADVGYLADLASGTLAVTGVAEP